MSHVNEDSDPTDITLSKYVDHPSILKIKEYFNEPIELKFLEVIQNDLKKEIRNLNSSKKVHSKTLL